MSASPACFAHLTHLLMPLAQGRIVLSLEGGYNHRSLAEGVCASLKTLLGDPCPRLTLPFAPSQSALDSVSDAIAAHSKFWRILQDREGGGDPPEESENRGDPPTEMVGEPGLDAALDAVMEEVMRLVPEQRTGLVYDERMKEHYNLWDSHHPELPQRISRIYQRHDELRILQRCSRLHPRLATQEELHMCHGLAYIKKMAASVCMKPRELHRLGSEFNSIYMNSKSYSSACLAAGSTLSVVEAVIMGKVQNGVSIVRPPGHHAEPDAACGFCFFNSVALAARYAQTLTGPSEQPMRVLIVDWDVHHGNGTQHIFQDDASVLYVSLHRYDDGLFFPCSEDASHDQVGRGDGEGFNVNIPWNGGKMGDAEYLMAFHGVVMPIAYEFNPQLVLVSAGFDAARGDPLGGCQVTPEGYAHMTHLLMGLAGGRVVLVLEGGYNLTSISESMTMCSRTLLGDPPPSLTDLRPPRAAALCSLRSVVRTHRRYWRSLRLKMTAPHHPAAGARDPALSPHTTSTSAPPPQHPENSPEDRTLRLVSHQGDVGDPITRLQDSDPGAMAQNCPLWGPESEERGHTDPTHQHPGAGDREGPSGPEEKSPVSLLEEERGGGSVHGPHTGLGKEGEIVEESRECEERGPHTHLEEPSGESPEEPGGESPEEPGGESPGGESPEEPRGESPEEPGGESLEEPRGESPEEPRGESLEEPRVESPTQQLVHLRDLQLTGGGGSSPCVTGASGSDKGPGAPNTQVQCQLLSEAAGGCDTGTSHTLCQLLGDSGAGFAVTPLSWCPHLASVCAVPSCGLDVTQPCAECGSDQENWVCLTCYQVLCGRYVSHHMVSHGVTSGHDLVLSFSDLSVWCYSCETYVHHQALHAAKRSAYYAKFGEEMAMI
ncbi:protein deacetylase HDAC6 isoform X2 [Ascaphus truei]|uniref:protein deacetylase HDAC6 isoform X2 n=1 Tax=Ascaphus truei TaxID=8439 RepID=UPI003F5AA1CE